MIKFTKCGDRWRAYIDHGFGRITNDNPIYINGQVLYDHPYQVTKRDKARMRRAFELLDGGNNSWGFWVLLWENGHNAYQYLGSSSAKWPVSKFEALAAKYGFTELRTDKTLIGGYFVQPGTGDCLLCVPSGIKPWDLY